MRSGGGPPGAPEGPPGARNPPADALRPALSPAPRSPSVAPTRKTSTIPRKETAPERVPNRSNAEIERKWTAADQKRGQRIRVVSPAAAFAFLRVMASFPPRPRFLSDPRLGAQEEVDPGGRKPFALLVIPIEEILHPSDQIDLPDIGPSPLPSVAPEQAHPRISGPPDVAPVRRGIELVAFHPPVA